MNTENFSNSAGPAKEGIVLDREGNAIYEPGPHPQGDPFAGLGSGQPRVRVFRGGWGLAALLGIGIPLFLVAGLVILGIFLTVLLTFWVLRTLLGGGRPSGPTRGSSVRVF
jgi:hypothetical protein